MHATVMCIKVRVLKIIDIYNNIFIFKWYSSRACAVCGPYPIFRQHGFSEFQGTNKSL